MKYAHKVKARVFVKSEEDYSLIKEGLLWLMDVNEPLEKLKYEEEEVTGLEGESILVINLEIDKNREINDFLKLLKYNLSDEQINYLLKERKPDEKANFFIRFDKKSVLDKSLELTEDGDCYHIRVSLAAYPSNADTAYGVLEEIF